MEKKVYPILEGDNGSISEDVMKSLDRISKKESDNYIREVFLSKDGRLGYVWCFLDRSSFNNSILFRIQDGDYSDFTHLANEAFAASLVNDLRKAYNKNTVKFVKFEFENPFYDSCTIRDGVFDEKPKRHIEILLAGNSGVSEKLERILNKYKVLT